MPQISSSEWKIVTASCGTGNEYQIFSGSTLLNNEILSLALTILQWIL